MLTRMPTRHLTLKGWNRDSQVAEIRREALERLYVRRDAVDVLIRSLENYQRVGPPSSSASCCTAGGYGRAEVTGLTKVFERMRLELQTFVRVEVSIEV
jgi:hypothetical protein